MKISYFLILLFAVASCGVVSCDTNSDENYAIVFIDDQAVQCESKGVSEQQTAQILIAKGINVVASQCGYLSGVAVAAQCGLGDINIHLHTINARNLPEAQALGFKSVSTLKREDDTGYVIIDCPAR